jgi:prephenate dehydrogenase
MKEPSFEKLAIVGVGLLGGSLALAAKERKLADHVLGIGRSEESLKQAVEMGAIDDYTTDLAAGVAEADIVVLCTPVRHITASVPTVMAHIKPGAIVTDVGSTKCTIVDVAEAAAASSKGTFVGAHPMAGSEKSGVAHARPDLFAGTNCFITPTPRTPLQTLATVAAWWRALGCRLAIARPQRHDALVALVSHLPHLVAVALVRAVESFEEDQNLLKGIIGNGFRDTTRIASGSAQVWQDICAENSKEIESAIAAFRRALDDLIAAHTSDSQALERAFLAVCEFRKSLDER